MGAFRLLSHYAVHPGLDVNIKSEQACLID